MKKRFFYVASIDSSNGPEIRVSGCIDTSINVDTLVLVGKLKSECEEKGFKDVSVHISQLIFLMNVIE